MAWKQQYNLLFVVDNFSLIVSCWFTMTSFCENPLDLNFECPSFCQISRLYIFKLWRKHILRFCLTWCLGCVKKNEPKNLIFYLWFPIVLGPQDSEFFSQKNFRISFTYPLFVMKIGTKNSQIITTKNGKILKWP